MSRIAMNMPRHIRLKPNQVATLACVVRQIVVIALSALSSHEAHEAQFPACLRVAKLGAWKLLNRSKRKTWPVWIAGRSGDVHRPDGPNRPGNSGVKPHKCEIARFRGR